MGTTSWLRVALMIVCLGTAPASLQARGADRPADQIIAEIRGVAVPELNMTGRDDRQAMRAALAKRRTALERKATLIGTLQQQHPEAPELDQLLPERWEILLGASRTAPKAQAELDKVLNGGKNPKLVREAAYLRILQTARSADQEAEVERAMPLVERFIERYRDDERGAVLLAALANQTGDADRRSGLNRRIEKEYPSSAAAQAIAAGRQALDPVGKPFRFDFRDVMTGRRVSSATLKGKVVIIDFWATWCVPCVDEIPKMKQLYAEYRGKGVEFVGISLDRTPDQGGYEKLTAFLEQNRVAWPQWYQGKAWDNDLAKAYQVQRIPTVFAVGPDGNLATVNARGRLDQVIPELLAQADKTRRETPSKP